MHVQGRGAHQNNLLEDKTFFLRLAGGGTGGESARNKDRHVVLKIARLLPTPLYPEAHTVMHQNTVAQVIKATLQR